MLDDLKFSNPADPQQWEEKAYNNRKDADRPVLVFDQTNQYIAQVVNDARQNKPAIKPLPVDSDADTKVAEILEGVIRHIEYVSRADIAYDTATECAARIGVGYIRVINKVVRPDTNEQEVVIVRVHDPLSVTVDPESTMPDASDACWFAIETVMSKEDFRSQYPRAEEVSYDGEAWNADENSIKILEYFEVVENKQAMVTYLDPAKGDWVDGTPDDLKIAQQAHQWINGDGAQVDILNEWEKTERKITWVKMSGAEILEQSEFPSQYLPIAQVTGYETWIEGDRYYCGMVRRMRDAQQSYNYERTAYIESVALQPSSPFIAPAAAIAGYEGYWENANTTRKAILPYNHVDGDNNPLPPPVRVSPPGMPAAYVQGSQMALADIQASIGMYRANLGAPSNETSGKAITARKIEGDTANYHYIDNLNRAIEQLGRIVVDMIPHIYDSKRIARIIGLDGTHDFVTIDPQAPQAYSKDEQGKVTINPNVGCYDVRIVAGPSYTTMRQEAAAGLSQVLQANPGLTPVIGPMWAQMQDWPDADRVAKALTAMAPPQVQDILKGNEDGQSPEMRAFAAETKQHMDKMQAIIQQQQQQMAELQAKAQEAEESQQIEWYKAETDRLKSLQPAATAIDPQMIAAIVQQTMMQMLQMQPAQGQIPPEPQEYQPPAIMPTEQPPSGGFFMPEE